MNAIRSMVAAALLFGVVEVAHAQQPVTNATSVLTVSKMCCAKESKPAAAALMQIPGVKNVMPNHKARTLTIVAHPAVSPRAMWESIENLQLGPSRLATAGGVWVKKPTR